MSEPTRNPFGCQNQWQRLAAVSVPARDPEGLARYYVECFGFVAGGSGSVGSQVVSCSVWGHDLELCFQRAERGGQSSLTFYVADLHEAATWLAARGKVWDLAPMVSDFAGWSDHVLCLRLRDLEGNQIWLQARHSPD